MRYLVTGGSGFIGSELIYQLLKLKNSQVVNVDNETYASNKKELKNLLSEFSNIKQRYNHHRFDINNKFKFSKLLIDFKPQIIFHLAAESHVDNSIKSSNLFITTNINGTHNILKCVNEYLNQKKKLKVKFIHVSTDEVFGDFVDVKKKFNENSLYSPSSPYSASKASSDLLVKAWQRTYDFQSIITNCSNNYGPRQNFEKLIPTIISSALSKRTIPIYGDGSQIREWIHVTDHVKALILISQKANFPNQYVIGSGYRVSNLSLTNKICKILNKYYPSNIKYENLIKFVPDRPGHDLVYSLNSKKINKDLNWKTSINFFDGLKETIDWYVNRIKK